MDKTTLTLGIVVLLVFAFCVPWWASCTEQKDDNATKIEIERLEYLPIVEIIYD